MASIGGAGHKEPGDDTSFPDSLTPIGRLDSRRDTMVRSKEVAKRQQALASPHG